MVHLVIHLPDEAIQGGPEEYRWMYPFERYTKKLKNYVKNKAKPEGSIAEGYVAEEALTFCSQYLKGVETRFNRHGRNEDGLNRTHEFKICEKSVKKDPTYTPELFSLACGPNAIARSFTTCLVNGVRFLVHECDIHRTTQNSEVSTPGEHGEMYYGRLEEILKLTYIRNCKDAYRNQQYILATQARQVCYLEDPARRPLHWKVVEEVHHRKNFLRDIIVVEDEQDVIHGGNSSDVELSNEFPDLDDTVLSTNDESTEVDVPLDTEVHDDDDDFIYDIDDVAHDIGSDDEVDPTDDEFAKVDPTDIKL
ncbi:hypothetical protein Tco_1025680 [Tanacetum coccineum]